MRNTKIALAVLALVASTAAMADAKVYGALEGSMNRVTGGNTVFEGTGGWGGSYFGITGSDELEGGMKASFALEGGLDIGSGAGANGGVSTATATGATFNRQANVALSGDFGTVKGGLQFDPWIAAGATGTNGNNNFLVPLLVMTGNNGASNGGSGTSTTGGFFIPNSVSYTSPSMGGFSASVLGSTGNGVAANEYNSYAANYAQGDVAVGAAYHKRNGATAAEVTSGSLISAGYQMGAARLGGGYVSSKTDAANSTINTYFVGVAYNLGAPTLHLNYARNNETNAKSIINVAAQYSLSKNTFAFVSASRGNNGAGTLYAPSVANSGTNSQTGYTVGIRTQF